MLLIEKKGKCIGKKKGEVNGEKGGNHQMKKNERV